MTTSTLSSTFGTTTRSLRESESTRAERGTRRLTICKCECRYVHFVEDTEVWRGLPESQIKPRSTDPFRSILRSPVEGKHDDKLGEYYPEPTAENPTLFIACGDFKTESSIRVSELKGDLIAIGRSYISNPDLKERIQNDLPWTQYNRDTFYLPLSDTGYLDYAVAGQRGHGEEAEEKKKQEKENKANM